MDSTCCYDALWEGQWTFRRSTVCNSASVATLVCWEKRKEGKKKKEKKFSEPMDNSTTTL